MSVERATVVFDCSVFARALINPYGPAGACVTAAQRGQVRLVVCEDILAEVLELPLKLPPRRGVTAEHVHRLIADLTTYAEPVLTVPRVVDLPADPDDAVYLNLAIAVGARWLLTNDQHLLAVMATGHESRGQVEAACPGLEIVTPEVWLRGGLGAGA